MPAADQNSSHSKLDFPRSGGQWFLRGLAKVGSIPALVLMTAQIGFAALAREAGFTLWQTVCMTGLVWALPGQVVFVGSVASGASMATVVLAVSLSAVRFMPMVMAWTPVVRAPGTPRTLLYFLSWFVAVTAWVFAMTRLPHLPREARAPFFAGFGMGLTVINMGVVAASYVMIADLAPWLAAALMMLTPVYFLLALWSAGRAFSERLAMVVGLVLGPLFHFVTPRFDLLLAGFLGGTLAYFAGRAQRAP